ncbi:MAG: hypothetical protein LBG60_01795, partial [Bifidobacteriaceae bacterium]|nr:hypothetical protein [Bifidobacteriaceae bacterium]
METYSSCVNCPPASVLPALVAEKKQLEDEQDRLLDAHLAGHLAAGIMSRKQDLIQVRLDEVNQ